MLFIRLIFLPTILSMFCIVTLAFAQQPGATVPHDHDHAHRADHVHDRHRPHFNHPLVAESPSPDTKLRAGVEYSRFSHNGNISENLSSFFLEGEYAFHPSFSVEVGLPLVRLNATGESAETRLGTVEFALKFANFALGDRGVLLGYGIEFGLPTGNDASGIGSDHILEVEPFFNVGYWSRRFEAVGFVKFGIPTRQEAGEEIETEFGYNVSLLYKISDRVQGLGEVDGESVLSGEENESEAAATVGLRVSPMRSQPLFIGVGLSVPVNRASELSWRGLLSVFYHF